MNKILKVSTLLLAGIAALPAAAQQYGGPAVRVQGETAREQRDEGRGRDDVDRPQRVSPGETAARLEREDRDNRNRDRRGDQRDGRHDNDDRRGNNGRYDNDGRYGNNGRYDNNGRYGNNGGYSNGNGRDDRHDNRHDRHDRHDNRHDRRDWRHDHRRYASYRYRAPIRYIYPRGYRHYNWYVGSYLPPTYYGSYYYIDHHYYRLPPPPRGYRWIRVDNDVFLVAIGSGFIRDILYGLFY